MKRIICLFISVLCTVMMVSTLAFAAETPLENTKSTNIHLKREEYPTLYVKTDGGNLNVRSDAGTEYSIVGKLANGTKIAEYLCEELTKYRNLGILRQNHNFDKA